jgi:hypothetical protein
MSGLAKLFDIPSDIAFSFSQKQILVSSRYTASLSSSDVVSIFSHSSQSVVGTLSDVTSIVWIKEFLFDSPILAATGTSSLRLFSFSGSLLESPVFDQSNKLATFSVTPINDSISQICELSLNSPKLIAAESYSVFLTDADNNLRQFRIYPDGIYPGAKVAT